MVASKALYIRCVKNCIIAVSIFFGIFGTDSYAILVYSGPLSSYIYTVAQIIASLI